MDWSQRMPEGCSTLSLTSLLLYTHSEQRPRERKLAPCNPEQWRARRWSTAHRQRCPLQDVTNSQRPGLFSTCDTLVVSLEDPHLHNGAYSRRTCQARELLYQKHKRRSGPHSRTVVHSFMRRAKSSPCYTSPRSNATEPLISCDPFQLMFSCV